MNQQEAVQALKNNQQQAEMFNEVLKIISDAIKAEMPVFRKLVQFDALSAIQKKAAGDKVADKPSNEAELTKVLDGILKQVDKDLEKQIAAKFASVK